MRKISILSLVAVGLILSSIFIHAQPFAMTNPKSGINITYNDDKSIKRVDVAFTNELTLDSLVDIKARLLEFKIALSYESMEFDKKGNLIGFTCRIDHQESRLGGYVITPSIHTGETSGFYYDYSVDEETAFCRGTCWSE